MQRLSPLRLSGPEAGNGNVSRPNAQQSRHQDLSPAVYPESLDASSPHNEKGAVPVATAPGYALPPSEAPYVDPDDFDEGGASAWTAVFGAWCTLFCTFGLGNSVGVFQAYYVSDALKEYPSSTISWVTGVFLWTLNFMPVIFGRVYDRFGPKWIVVGGTLTYVFGMMMVSLSTEFWHFFLAMSIVAPIGSSAAASASMSATLSWFRKKRATAFGIMMSGSSVGGVVLPIMISRMIDRVGFPWTIRAVAFLFLALMGVSCCTVRSRLQPEPRPLVLREYVQGLREPAMTLTVFGMFLFFWGMFLPFNFIILQAKAQGMSPGLVIYLLPIMHAHQGITMVSIVGRILPGILADKFGRYNVMICIVTFAAVFTLSIWIPSKTNTAIIAFTILFGFSSGSFTSLAPTLVAQISDIRQIGIRTGTAFAVQSFGALTGSPIASAIVESQGGRYLGLQLFCGLAMLASAVVFFFARHVQVGLRLNKV
ncbi:riboflavin transporter MCH5 [Verticillium alfalfae VaMs.102]|uniref:Riboflavin transporter MCH5 n=1 Tax=Verticillium alfalfae (strain VaMs.102 / ATCC MYA-4576 / FGSC 10136) TaxID=526221 RepID=C9SWR6_VERA1|nr:riboflavin transporter MCH5 [Verticillium alfalfae VaMs.102]EEY23457.1 riboflavin transporter MCH5 [Verticillium alfalfae VaMs.102]